MNRPTEHYVYDGEQVILEFVDLDGPGSAAQPVPIVRNLFGPGIDMILAQQQIGTSDTRWLLTDHLGTVRDLASNTGQRLNHLQYDSFGNLLAQSAPTIATRYGFTGRELDTSLGLYYYRARYYSPELGRFLQQDPIAFAGQDENLYRYVFNQPTVHTDPSGKIVPILLGIWAVAEVALAVYDAYDTASTIADPCASAGEKVLAGGLWAAGAMLPGGGYSQIDNVARAAAKGMTPRAAAKGMTPDQRALKELVDEATRNGRKPLTRDNAETILDWADEVNYPGVRAKPGDVADPSNWTANPVPHIHIPGAGRGGHVPVEPGVRPRN